MCKERDIEILKYKIADLEKKIADMKKKDIGKKNVKKLEFKKLEYEDMLSEIENQ